MCLDSSRLFYFIIEICNVCNPQPILISHDGSIDPTCSPGVYALAESEILRWEAQIIIKFVDLCSMPTTQKQLGHEQYKKPRVRNG